MVTLRLESARPRDHIRALVALAAVVMFLRYGSFALIEGALGALLNLPAIGSYAASAHLVYRRETRSAIAKA